MEKEIVKYVNLNAKKVRFGFLAIIVVLAPMILKNLGAKLSITALIFLGAAILMGIATAVWKEHKKVLGPIAIVLCVLFVSVLIKERNVAKAEAKLEAEKAAKAAKHALLTTTPPSPVPVTKGKPSEVTKTSWGYVINFTGAEANGVKVLTAEKDADVLLRWVEGGQIHNPEDAEPHRTDPWGYTYYVDGWKGRFKFGWCPGVKPHAVLALVRTPGESLDSLRQEYILFFDKEKKEKEFKVHMNSGEELWLYYHDVDEQFYFQRNGSDDSYMRFEIVIVL